MKWINEAADLYSYGVSIRVISQKLNEKGYKTTRRMVADTLRNKGVKASTTEEEKALRDSKIIELAKDCTVNEIENKLGHSIKLIKKVLNENGVKEYKKRRCKYTKSEKYTKEIQERLDYSQEIVNRYKTLKENIKKSPQDKEGLILKYNKSLGYA